MNNRDEAVDFSRNESEATLLSTGERLAVEYDERKAKRHLRGWLSYAFARSVYQLIASPAMN